MTSPSIRPHGVLQRFERELLAWVVVWAPYGGASDIETFPEFGLSTSEANDRVAHLVCERLRGDIPTHKADRTLVAKAWMALQPMYPSTLSVAARAALHAAASRVLTDQNPTTATSPAHRSNTRRPPTAHHVSI